VFFSNFAGRFKIFFVSVVVVLYQRKCAEVEEKESFGSFFAHCYSLDIQESKIYATCADKSASKGSDLGSFFWDHSAKAANSVIKTKDVNIIYRNFNLEITGLGYWEGISKSVMSYNLINRNGINTDLEFFVLPARV
jgi:hypothetical protein